MYSVFEVKIKSPLEKIYPYKKLNEKSYKEIINLSKKIKGKTVIHINSTSAGGGVAELLKNQVSIERSLGVESYWLAIEVEEEFFKITKKIHNLLQGKKGFLSKKEKDFYLAVNKILENDFSKFLKKFKKAIVILHDPQVLPLIKAAPKDFISIFRLHTDASSPDRKTVDFITPFIKECDAFVLSNKAYISGFPKIKKTKIIYPAINPFQELNREMHIESAKEIVLNHGINPEDPIISQVSRFDIFKDPISVISAYKLAKKKIPNLQLVLVGFIESVDDPEAISVLKKVERKKGKDSDIYIFSDFNQLNMVSQWTFINAIRTVSKVIIQASIKEGFGLVITEAMWKEKPVVARKNSGSLLQIKHNKNGILFDSIKEMEEEIISLIKNKKKREKLGKMAKSSVKKNFLFSFFILENLRLYNEIKNNL